MSVVSVNPRSFILALFIRDDGERFLLGDNGYDFKSSQLHFAANTIENDEVAKQGTDGTMLAGQVRRSAVQSFDGYVGDATMAKETIEQMRRDFFAFFVRGHHFRVIYVDCNRNAWQRKGGYLVDAPEVKELWQIHPEYHVGLNFEDVNYYSYDEDADGEEILSNLVDVPVSTATSGGLVWDEDGAVSEDAEVEYDTETAVATPAKNVYITDATEAPLSSFQLDGETSQNGTPTPDAPVPVQTVTGENVVKITGKNLLKISDGVYTVNGITATISNGKVILNGTATANAYIVCSPQADWYSLRLNGTYTFSAKGLNNVYYAVYYGTASTVFSTQTSQTKTISDSLYTNVRFQISVLSGTTLNNEVIDPQLELGSTATAYEPYQGQSYEVNLGKNLYDEELRSGDISTPHSNPTIRLCSTQNLYLHPGTYTFSTNMNSPMRYAIGINSVSAPPTGTYPTYIYDSGWVVGTGSNTTTFTINQGGYFSVQLSKVNNAELTTSEAQAYHYQLEKGSQATTYAAYFEPIELCNIPGTDYRDRIIPRDGKWYIHKAIGKITFDGTENWAYDDASATVRRFVSPVISGAFSSTSRSDIYSNYFKYRSSGSDYGTGFLYAAKAYFYYGDTSTPVATFKTWLSSHNTDFYYKLATPTDTEITNEALIEQLEAVLGGHTYAGTNNITTITPNEQGTLEISYYTKYRPIVVSGGYIWEAGGSGGATTVINNSIDNVSPIWKIYGPTQNPQLENSTTGETIEYVGMIAEGQTLTIDMGEQTASLDGLNVISNIVGDFISLAPGANRLIYSVLGDAGASSIGWSEIVG